MIKIIEKQSLIFKINAELTGYNSNSKQYYKCKQRQG